MIIIPKICGTCNGANNAINKVLETYEKENQKKDKKTIVVYKEILHNKRVINDLIKKGINCVNDLSNINSNNIVVIRAHGEGEQTFKYLNEKNIDYVDATCPNVTRIHEIIKEKYKNNYTIIIIGKKITETEFHPEVEGSNGWCNNTAYIIDNEKDIETIKETNDNILIICQTTANEEKVIMLADKIKNKFKNKNVEFVNSICNAQKLIQKHSINVAKEVDKMIVIGGKNSSNTTELYKKCALFCPSDKISTLDDLKEWLINNKDLTNETKIGITGGASTPQYEIEEYKNYIEAYLDKKNEYRDLYDENRNLTGRFIKKGDSVPANYFYTIVAIWIENSEGKILIQKRVDNKGGKWATTGGHPKILENSIEGIITEVKEELGINLIKEKIKLIKTVKTDDCFVDLYYINQNINSEEFKLQKEEVSDIAWKTSEEINELIKNNEFHKKHILMFEDLKNYLNNIK